jgi:hypothetical protein
MRPLKKMAEVLMASATAALLSGCATAMLPQGPDIYSFSVKPNAPSIIVARAIDERTDKQRLGSIGATRFSMKADPVELVGKEAVAALYDHGFNARLGQLSPDQPETFAEEARRSEAQGILALRIKALSIESFDLLMDPPTAKATLQATLYDHQGNTVETSEVTGLVQHGISAFSLEKSGGKLVGEAIREAAMNLTKPGALGTALKKLASSKTEEKQ